MNGTTENKKKRSSGRSPGYPAIDIQMALKRATELYNNVQHHSSNVDVASGHWGYNPGSGLAQVTIAALKKYGLIIDEGAGKNRAIRLTEPALDIIKDKRDESQERNQKIIKAALNPKIHKEMLEIYGNSPPSDADLMFELERKRGFTQNGAKDFISQYKRTLGYISTLTSGIIPPGNGDKGQDDEGGGTKPPFVPPPAGGLKPPILPKGENMKNIEIPTGIHPWPVLTVPFPMSETLWNQMMAMLEAMKPAIVEAEEPDSE